MAGKATLFGVRRLNMTGLALLGLQYVITKPEEREELNSDIKVKWGAA